MPAVEGRGIDQTKIRIARVQLFQAYESHVLVPTFPGSSGARLLALYQYDSPSVLCSSLSVVIVFLLLLILIVLLCQRQRPSCNWKLVTSPLQFVGVRARHGCRLHSLVSVVNGG